MSYLERWWKDAATDKREDFINLVHNGQLEIVGGGWVMNDEVLFVIDRSNSKVPTYLSVKLLMYLTIYSLCTFMCPWVIIEIVFFSGVVSRPLY